MRDPQVPDEAGKGHIPQGAAQLVSEPTSLTGAQAEVVLATGHCYAGCGDWGGSEPWWAVSGP